MDLFYDGSQGGTPGPISIIHDISTSVQYVVSNQVLYCAAQPLEQFVRYFTDFTTDGEENFQLVSPNNFFFLGSEFNYSYEGVSNIRGVDVDSWVSVRDFEKVTDAINLTDTIYEIFFTRPGWVYSTDRSITTDPVPWRIITTGTITFLNISDNSTVTYNDARYEMDFFDFSTDEPPYDAFDISLCSGPDDFYTMVLILPGQVANTDFGQLRRNIRMSVANYTGLRPLQIGNIQVRMIMFSHVIT